MSYQIKRQSMCSRNSSKSRIDEPLMRSERSHKQSYSLFSYITQPGTFPKKKRFFNDKEEREL